MKHCLFIKNLNNCLGPDQVTTVKQMMEKIQMIMRYHLVSQYCQVMTVDGWLNIDHRTTPSTKVVGPKMRLIQLLTTTKFSLD